MCSKIKQNFESFLHLLLNFIFVENSRQHLFVVLIFSHLLLQVFSESAGAASKVVSDHVLYIQKKIDCFR